MNQENMLFFEELKKIRKSKKITLKEISEYTKINITYLESLELGNFDVLPNVYTRLFLRSYCKYIGIDHKDILNQYEIYTVGNKKQLIEDQEPEQTLSNDESSLELGPRIGLKSNNYKEIIITTIIVIALIALFIIINTIN